MNEKTITLLIVGGTIVAVTLIGATRHLIASRMIVKNNEKTNQMKIDAMLEYIEKTLPETESQETAE